MILPKFIWGGGPCAAWWRGLWTVHYPSTVLRTVPLPEASSGRI
jgi:hypothetical protein